MRITEFSLIAAEYAPASKGISISFINDSDKVIKYIDVDVYPANGVGDIVSCDHSKKCVVSARHTGPIYPHKGLIIPASISNMASDSLWWNSTIRTAYLQKVTVIYMDGTVKEFTGDALNNIIRPITTSERTSANLKMFSIAMAIIIPLLILLMNLIY